MRAAECGISNEYLCSRMAAAPRLGGAHVMAPSRQGEFAARPTRPIFRWFLPPGVHTASGTIAIRPARPDDGPSLRGLERRAGERFREVGLGWVADHEP